jgi:hypothetical protein
VFRFLNRLLKVNPCANVMMTCRINLIIFFKNLHLKIAKSFDGFFMMLTRGSTRSTILGFN